MTAATYTKAGAKATTPAKLEKDVFGVEVKNHQLLKDAYLAYMAAGRSARAKTKRRGEVQGGGQKPWRQKGTGRARFGSSRNPLWRGGGVAFGPTGNENFARRLNVKAKRLALRQALSLAAKEERIKVIDQFASGDGKLKPAAALLSKIGANGDVLLVLAKKDELTVRATANLPTVKTVAAGYLNVFDVMNANQIVITAEALNNLSTRLGGKNG